MLVNGQTSKESIKKETEKKKKNLEIKKYIRDSSDIKRK